MGNYTSPISFNLNPFQDFMPTLGLQAAKTPTGSALLTWTPAPAANAYGAMAIGAGQQDTVAIWMSSDAQAAAFVLPDYLTPADQARLVRERALMPAGTSSCAMPKEFVDVAPTAFINLAGYGDEVNVAYPPRPADPKIAWNIDWTVKVRYRTAESALLGMPGAGGAGGPPARGAEQQQQQQTPQAPPTSARDAVMKGLGSAITGGLFGR
jgi:hypothetical protein